MSIIVTHGDIDGMACAAQLIRREGSASSLVWSNARWISKHLPANIRERAPQPLYITDIAPDIASARIIASLAEGWQIHWVDHHPWEQPDNEMLKSSTAHVIHVPRESTPGAVLLAQWLKHEDPPVLLADRQYLLCR